jgi:3-oxoacyl-[acyl-carrier protein] reductase
MPQAPDPGRPVALVTGASRKIGIAAAVVSALAESGWNVATTYWRPYDASMPWGSDASEAGSILDAGRRLSSGVLGVEADLSDPDSPGRVFDRVERDLGPVTALILSHCHSVDAGILDTTPGSFDLHFAVNARATWLLVREFGGRYRSGRGRGRIVSITSGHTAWNLAYGASKGAMDRIVLAAAVEFASLGVTANVISPGATDTGWMSEEMKESIRGRTPLGRVGLPADCANLVKFLCSEEGGWVNGQILRSDGGFF